MSKWAKKAVSLPGNIALQVNNYFVGDKLKENLDNYLVKDFKFSESLSSILDVVNEIWANKYRPKIEKSKSSLQLQKFNRFDSDDKIWSKQSHDVEIVNPLSFNCNNKYLNTKYISILGGLEILESEINYFMEILLSNTRNRCCSICIVNITTHASTTTVAIPFTFWHPSLLPLF